MLAVGLVLFTIVGLAIVAGRLLPGFDWRSAVLLGAVVAATDAIAATSIARRVGLPQQIVDILEAESLVNDGTGLVALQFGLLILVTGRTPSVIESLGRLIYLTGGGVLIGLAVGALVAPLKGGWMMAASRSSSAFWSLMQRIFSALACGSRA